MSLVWDLVSRGLDGSASLPLLPIYNTYLSPNLVPLPVCSSPWHMAHGSSITTVLWSVCNLGFTFIASHGSISRLSYNDSNTTTQCLAASSLRNQGKRKHDALTLIFHTFRASIICVTCPSLSVSWDALSSPFRPIIRSFPMLKDLFSRSKKHIRCSWLFLWAANQLPSKDRDLLIMCAWP